MPLKPLWLRLLQRVRPLLPFRLLVTMPDGFELGCFVWKWKRFGPFIWFCEMRCAGASEADPESIGPWELGVFLTKKAESEFYEGVCK